MRLTALPSHDGFPGGDQVDPVRPPELLGLGSHKIETQEC